MALVFTSPRIWRLAPRGSHYVYILITDGVTILMKYGVFALVMLLGGCVTTHNPIPEGYSGPLITIDDSFKLIGSRTAEMFYIQKINDKDVENAYRKSFGASSGQNGALVTQGYSHQLPAIKTKLLLSGEIMHGAPIGYLFNSGSNYVVRGEIEFSPEVNKHYLISGELSKRTFSGLGGGY